MDFSQVTTKPYFKDVAFIVGMVLVLGAWKYIIESGD